nr:MAG TPA: holin [Bacteriophage sp.]
MDINTIGVATVAAIIVICYLIGMVVKATALDSKWIPVICGVCGGIIGALALAFHMPDFPAEDYFTAVAVGIMSGLTATGVNQIFKQMSRAKEEKSPSKALPYIYGE